MAMAFRPQPSPCSIRTRNGSHSLVARSRLRVGGEIGWPKSVVTSLAGFASPGLSVPSPAAFASAGSVVTSLAGFAGARRPQRSEEHTSELQSRLHLVCRLLLEKKKKKVLVILRGDCKI